jgi:hypothetical protein
MNHNPLEPEELRSLVATLCEAQGWRPISDELLQQFWREVKDISGHEVIRMFGNSMATPYLKPAMLLDGLKQERRRLLEEQVASVPSGHKRYADMSPKEQAAYMAAQKLARDKLKADLASLYQQGKIPTTRVGGFSSLADVLVRTGPHRGESLMDEVIAEVEARDRLEAAGGSFR